MIKSKLVLGVILAILIVLLLYVVYLKLFEIDRLNLNVSALIKMSRDNELRYKYLLNQHQLLSGALGDVHSKLTYGSIVEQPQEDKNINTGSTGTDDDDDETTIGDYDINFSDNDNDNDNNNDNIEKETHEEMEGFLDIISIPIDVDKFFGSSMRFGNENKMENKSTLTIEEIPEHDGDNEDKEHERDDEMKKTKLRFKL